MTDEPITRDPRDVIARAIHQAVNDRDPGWAVWVPEADAVVAALAAAGLSITEIPDKWEWGLRREDGRIDGPASEDLARRVREHDGGTVVRRCPAGPWEVVDA